MRSICVFICALSLAGTLAAQADRTTYRVVNGRRVEVAQSSSTNGTTTQRAVSINGREVPIEERQEEILREDARGRVREITIQRYSRTGEPNETERIRIEETFGPNGSVSTRETYYETDGSGRMQEVERRQIQTRQVQSSQGPRTETNTTVERVDLNGSFQPDQRIREITTGPEGNTSTEQTVSRVGVNGRFVETERTVTSTQVNGATTTTNTAVYRPGATGRMDLMEQEVTRETLREDGTTVTEINRFGPAPAGRLSAPGARPQIIEQQVIRQEIQQDGSVLETVQLSQPTISDPNRLGQPRVIAETVCRGECLPPAEEVNEGEPAPPTEIASSAGAQQGQPSTETGQGSSVQTAGTLPAAVTPDPAATTAAPGTTPTAGVSSPGGTASGASTPPGQAQPAGTPAAPVDDDPPPAEPPKNIPFQ